MSRKVKGIFVLFVLIGIILSPLEKVNAHSVELDPDSLISMPMMIIGGSGKITIKNSVSNYILYFQGVEISSTVYSQIQKTESDGKEELNTIKEAYTALKTELDNLKVTFDEASDAYRAGITDNVSETELETLRTAYETARSNYQAKGTEYNNKVKEYNDKATEINDRIKELTPTYVESNWTQTTDDKISLDVTKFSGEQPYVIWVKLVTSGNTYYDEGIYTMTGTKATEINVKSVTLDKTSLFINEGSNYTLTATITPTDATNKSLTWTSDNEKVATVSNGKVTGVSEGSATITVTTADGDYTATCKVTVNKKVTTNDSNQETPKAETPEKTEDTTVKEGRLPNTGVSYTIVFVIAIIGIVGFILYRRVKYLNF